MNALSQSVLKLSRLQAIFGFRDLEIRSRSLNVELDLQIKCKKKLRPYVKELRSYRV